MAAMILPGTYIEVRPEGLIPPGQVSVGNVGVIGTASKGAIGVPVLLSSYADAVQHFYSYDPWMVDPVTVNTNALTLVRALEQVFTFGASIVYAVRVASPDAKSGTCTVKCGANSVALTASSEGTWSNDLGVNVDKAAADAFVSGEKHAATAPVTLFHIPKASARNRVIRHVDKTGQDLPLTIVYDGAPGPATGEAKIDRNTKIVTFGDPPDAKDLITVSYAVDVANARTVTLKLDRAQQAFTVVDGSDLIAQINAGSTWAGATTAVVTDLPDVTPPLSNGLPAFLPFAKGANGEISANYKAGLDTILDQEVHIVVAAGQTDKTFGNALDAHCQTASSDTFKRDRIAVVGSGPADPKNVDSLFDNAVGHNLDSDRVIFVSPGIMATDASATPVADVVLPGAYTAAAIAGLLASEPPHISLTNKTLSVDGLEMIFNTAQLTQLVENRVLAVESRHGFHIVKAITTTTGGAFAEITTRRIVDYAKFGVRLAADPYIGKLNNDRVRNALKATLTSFLKGMMDDEMLTAFDLAVTATRAEEIRGIVNVTMTLQPVFSINFIKVTMILQ